MKTLVYVAHPNIEESTINKAWLEAAEKVEGVTLRQICQLYPDGEIDLALEQGLMEEHDRIIWQYPFYWYAAPWELKRFIDKTFTFGWAYGAGGMKLQGKEIGVAVSCGSPEEAFSPEGSQKHSLGEYLNVMDGIAAFVGMKYIGHWSFYDTYNKEHVLKELEPNCQGYQEWLVKGK